METKRVHHIYYGVKLKKKNTTKVSIHEFKTSSIKGHMQQRRPPPPTPNKKGGDLSSVGSFLRFMGFLAEKKILMHVRESTATYFTDGTMRLNNHIIPRVIYGGAESTEKMEDKVKKNE